MSLTAKQKMINLVAPALRVLLAERGFNKIVMAVDNAADAAVKVALPAGAESAEAVAAELRKALYGGMPACVIVEGAGAFQVFEPSVKHGRVAGKIAMVTGGAQGFGFGIAQDLIAQGAYVAVLDVNPATTAKAVEELKATSGHSPVPGAPPRVIGLTADVASAEAMAAAVHATVCAFGGLDILVANAGVLRAGSVKTLSEKDFDFVTTVNYKGYFICVQAVAPVMAAQHAADPAQRMDIIQINSKSGLEGSNKNGAYAGSKFGSIGLTQSFAMELVTDGIKVNAICPGNFFDGPLWSDPDKGLFVQYLRTGKVPGARTVAEVRKFYEAKVPMGRGCEPADVMKAIFYLVDQQYETGQALPVTGGQVMLN
jgi:sorbitol-6-phosphate 2-dehydrogenase